jgi:hypothetical protein
MGNPHQTGLYNVAIGMPPLKLAPMVPLQLSRHAIQAAASDRYGHCNVPAALQTDAATLVELELGPTGMPVKGLFRLDNQDGLNDLLIVVNLDIASWGLVRTVWLNRKSDQHRTLDASRYRRIA